MGAWGYGNFENDGVLDSLNYFVEAEDSVGIIGEAFRWLDEPGGLSDDDACSEMLAACELIAALKGAPAPDLPDNVQDWVKAHQSEEVQPLLPLALSAIEQVTTESELKNLWEGSDDYSNWLAVQADLRARLQS
jgi:hypothetical protein